MGIAQPPMQRPQVPPQMARTPQFNAAKQVVMGGLPQIYEQLQELITLEAVDLVNSAKRQEAMDGDPGQNNMQVCLLYTSPSPRDRTRSRMPSSA